MPKIEIISPRGDGPRHVLGGWGTKLIIDGREVSDVCDIRASWPVDGAVEVQTRVLASEKLDFCGDGTLVVALVAMPGYVVIQEPQPDGRTRWRCEPERPATPRAETDAAGRLIAWEEP